VYCKDQNGYKPEERGGKTMTTYTINTIRNTTSNTIEKKITVAGPIQTAVMVPARAYRTPTAADVKTLLNGKRVLNLACALNFHDMYDTELGRELLNAIKELYEDNGFTAPSIRDKVTVTVAFWSDVKGEIENALNKIRKGDKMVLFGDIKLKLWFNKDGEPMLDIHISHSAPYMLGREPFIIASVKRTGYTANDMVVPFNQAV